MAKKTEGYTDCKIYQKRSDDSSRIIIGIDFGDFHWKRQARLVRGNVTPSRATDGKHLLKKLAEEIERILGSDVCLESPTVTFEGKLQRVEFATSSSETNKTKKALLSVLKKEYKLHVAITQ